MIVTFFAVLKQKKTIQGVGFQQIIVLNIAIDDLMMGIYLITIAAYSELFSGYYGVVDQEWRSSLKCSIIGSLVVISSETSCFLMVVLTAFRLTNIVNAIGSLASSSRRWVFCAVVALILSLIIGIVPIISSYFMHSFSFSTTVNHRTLESTLVTEFACRVAALCNKTIEYNDNECLTKSNLRTPRGVGWKEWKQWQVEAMATGQ